MKLAILGRRGKRPTDKSDVSDVSDKSCRSHKTTPRLPAKQTYRRQAEPPTTLPVAPEARQEAPQPATKERYRAAIREFCQGGDEGVDCCPRPSRRPLTRLAGASENTPLKQTYRRQAEPPTTLPVVPEARQKAPQPATKERYRKAGRVLRRVRCGSGLNVLDHIGAGARRAPAKREHSACHASLERMR